MKWPKSPADLLTDKTFLVIREDLRNIEAHGHLCPRKPSNDFSIKTPSTLGFRCTPAEKREKIITADCQHRDQEPVARCSCSDTWPPKMRKKRPRKTTARADMYEISDAEEPRPATASLEAPVVLDPRLVDKLDMSLLSKESLSESLTRINLGLTKAVTVLDAKIAESRNNNAPTTRLRARFAAISPTRFGRKGSFDSSESDTTRTTSTSNETASSPEAKRLDDNNNKNKSGSGASSQPLSPVRSRSSRSSISSSDVALFTAAAKKKTATEPCQACGRAAQPERFHSHPKSPTSSPSSARSSLSVIPVRALVKNRKTSARADQQQQIPGVVPEKLSSPRTEQIPTSLKIVASPTLEEKFTSDEESRKVREANSATISKLNEDKSSVSLGKRRPRTVTCYICGREFGTASFPIHEPKCLQKWQRENKALPSSQRRNVPQRPNVPIDHEDWNTAAWEQSQALLIPCLKCKRTFLPDRLAIHERNCRVPNKVFH